MAVRLIEPAVEEVADVRVRHVTLRSVLSCLGPMSCCLLVVGVSVLLAAVS